jgi:hypothetical protein
VPNAEQMRSNASRHFITFFSGEPIT